MNPKFILSKSIVLEQYDKVKKLCDVVSYSSKTNPLIAKILEEKTDSLFSIHMVNELKNIQDKSRVMLLAQGWNEELIDNLIKQKISHFVVDNETDLDMMLKYLETHSVSITLLLRLRLKENTLKTERYFVFGMNSDVVNRRIQEIAQSNVKGKIKNLGIHFHRKSQNMSEWNLVYELSNSIDTNTLKDIDVMCIGGGIPAEYANTNVDVIESIFKRITEFKNWLNSHNIKLMIEPGRFIAAPAVKLETSIIGIHENNIIVNASVYNSDMDALIVPVKLLIDEEVDKDSGKPYVVKGITPCSMDLFRYRVYLKNPKIGDTITFLNAGAYNFTTDFCDLDKIETEIID